VSKRKIAPYNAPFFSLFTVSNFFRDELSKFHCYACHQVRPFFAVAWNGKRGGTGDAHGEESGITR